MNIDREKYFTITVLAEFDLDNDEVPKCNGMIFSCPGAIPKDAFFDEEGIPNEAGSAFITKFLVEALAGNIHVSHQKGHIDSAEHLREVIDRLEDLFVANVTFKGGFEDEEGWINKENG